ncbi:MAG: pullulanase-type alpha-1,6-glucosidase [Candidatus Eisenbacteria bacterium]|nr:pullulanase-type alpha-1,6-glucosidase [Candidatus Eisenbacteria bacterium]
MYMLLAISFAASAASAEDATFTFEPPEDLDVQSVSVRGSFNNWGETAMEPQDDGTWSVTIDLSPGEHTYKYFINGEWPGDMSTWLDGGPVDPAAEDYVDDGYGGMNAVRVIGGGRPSEQEDFGEAPPLAEGQARIHYHRPKGGYGGWGLHAWEDTEATVEWTDPLPPTGRDNYGLYWDLELTDGAERVGFIVHKGDTKDPGPDMFLDIDEHGREVWLVSGSTTLHTEEPDVSTLAFGNLSRQQAYWVDRSTIAWKVRAADGDVFTLHVGGDEGLEITADGVVGGEDVVLTHVSNSLPRETLALFPHLAGYDALALPEGGIEMVPSYLKRQLAVSVTGADGVVRDATGLQLPGILDDLFAYDGPLGLTWDGDVPTMRVWAPTAQNVWLHLFDSSTASEPAAVREMTEQNGVWSLTGEPGWKGKYYVYEVKVFMPQTGQVERNVTTDPYSRSLSMNSERTQIVDLDDPDLKPSGWDDFAKPSLEAPEDIAIYELHVRDFSATDPTVPEEHVGTFMAFADDTNGTRHLEALAEAGLTHIHLLPSFDIASVNEDKSTWEWPGDLSVYPPDSREQQAAVAAVQDVDGFNWGYDPYHFGVPEGSYSTEPDGPARVLEFREMVKALSDMGLRVVMDVVYNHTHASGRAEMSVFDKVVPGYYHRLNQDGFVETSTCCQNTASEHYMMERFMVDDLVHWARDYKVDGFRFDLMGHHMKRNMEKARDALHALRLESDGVDGAAIYLYGEGWDFGEVQGGRRGVNATQINMAGTGVGTFNDRIRDAIRGGSPFGDRRDQGFATGLYTNPSGFNGSGQSELDRLLDSMDRIRVGMAGNLRNYLFIDHLGRETTGGRMDNVGYTLDPQEVVNYVSAHDNETWFDKIQYAAPRGASVDNRVRMQNLGLSVVALGQGIPFFHAGSDMLRSKSMDRDSYNSGDWFNTLDWSYEMNNFGVGLPIADKNQERWDIIGPLLAREEITPERESILQTVHHFREMLSIRKSTVLLRLRTASDIQARVRFHNTGRNQVPGLIVMGVSDVVPELRPIDPNHKRVVVILNGTPETQTFSGDAWKGAAMELHPVLQMSHDEIVKQSTYDAERAEFSVPGMTAAVFVEPE